MNVAGKPRGQRSRLSTAGVLAGVMILTLIAGLSTASCAGKTPLTSTSTAISTEPTAAQLWERCLAWIRDGNTEVKFGPYTVTYGDGAKVGELDLQYPVEGEPLIGAPCWWVNDTDYFYQDVEGPPVHVSTAMALAMTTEAYPQAQGGVQLIGLIRFEADPYLLLRLARVQGSATRLPDSNWSLVGETTMNNLLGQDLPTEQVARYFGTLQGKVSVSLEIKSDGTPVSMKWTVGGTAIGAGYTWSKTSNTPSLPHAWVDSDKDARASAEQSGWRTISEAAQESKFTIYWLGDPYEGLSLVNLHWDATMVLLMYERSASASSTSSTANADRHGYVLSETSVSAPPTAGSPLKGFTFYKSFGEGEDAYRVYTSAKTVGKKIVVQRGDTIVSITRSQTTAKDNTDLLAVAAALKKAQP